MTTSDALLNARVEAAQARCQPPQGGAPALRARVTRTAGGPAPRQRKRALEVRMRESSLCVVRAHARSSFSILHLLTLYPVTILFTITSQ
jgi:hypothetical protein